MATKNLNRINKITIVGGGTAGWITATYLQTALNMVGGEHPVEIQLIESPNIPTVGVGESTLPIMPLLLQTLRLDEAVFFNRTNATFKCAGRFVNWNVDKNKKPVTTITPFDGGQIINGYPLAYYFNYFGSLTGHPQYVDNIVPTQAVIDTYKAPRTLEMKDYELALGYSYHLDAKLFADYLREVAVERGVKHIQDDVLDVKQDERGYIASLQLQQRGNCPVEFVVDCTGFKGLIIRGILKEPFISYEDYFLCDRALPVIIPHKNPKQIRPATTATALSAGWMWNVPLFNRVGTGYVYSSKFIDDQQAQDEIMHQLGDTEILNEPRPISFNVGRSRRAWVKNCVAIGLSGSFVEPLEATAIGMIDKAARWLGSYFPDKAISPELANQYNTLMAKTADEARDFIFMHYYLSNRLDTPFWKAVCNDMTVPDGLREKLDLWKHVLPKEDITLDHQMFDYENFIYALYGKGYFDELQDPLGPSMSRESWQEYSDYLDKVRQGMLQKLPSHYDLLVHLRNRATAQGHGTGGAGPT